MVDKEYEGVEKGMNMPDAEASEGEIQMAGMESGEGMTKSKPEQQTADSDKSEGKTQTTGTDSGEGTAGNDSGQRTMDEEGSKSATQTNGTGGGNDPKPKPERKKSVFDILVGLAQIVASLAAVGATVLALFTLDEMQNQRNNAYKPELVVSPSIFEGGLASPDEYPIDGKYIFIYHQIDEPRWCYSETPPDIIDCLYLEVPHLTFRNIGLGTAKDIQITFSLDWIEQVAEELSSIDDYNYSVNTLRTRNGGKELVLSYDNPDSERIGSWIPLSDGEDLITKITYIAAEESSVNVALPESWIKALTVLYSRSIYKMTNSGNNSAMFRIEIPDPIINVKYLDIQGNDNPKGDLEIPWTGYVSYLNKFNSDNESEESTYLMTSFYEDYIK